VVVGIVAVLVLSGGIIAVVATDADRQASRAAHARTEAVVKQWWSGVSGYFDDLQTALDDSRGAANLDDKKLMATSCQEMHDVAEVKLKAHMPSPDPVLTAEVGSAIDDAHEAAHMCLAYVDGSMVYDGGQFHSYLDESERHLKAARDLVEGKPTQA